MIKFYLFLLLIFQVNVDSYDVYAVVETPQMPVNGGFQARSNNLLEFLFSKYLFVFIK